MTHLTTTKSFVRLSAAALAVGALVLATGCGDDKKDDSSATTTASVEVTVTGQWARTSPAAATMGAIYFTITSPVDDTLTGVAVDATVAKEAQMHEMVMAGSTETTMAMGSNTTMAMGSNTTMAGGEMTMQQVMKVDLPAATAVEFKPGSYHVMLIDLVKPLVKGSSIKLTLTLEKGGSITIDVPVLDEAP